ncbi:MAG TPA: hypothetical protein DCS48_07200 [Desulfovibrio sp.]|nr:hypothetical protein [Desulfovibrio sp.]
MSTSHDLRKPEWLSDWKIFFVFGFVCFAIAFGMRAMEFPKWDNPAYMVNGEYIMGTHDAYFWLAGAKGVGRSVDNPMAGVIRLLGTVTGAQYGNIAFWLPAVFAGFCAVAAFGWGMLLGGPWTGLIGAVYATSVPAYYLRTRLAYYDTDVVTLFFPLLLSLLAARWVSQGIRKSWLLSCKQPKEFRPTLVDFLLPVIGGGVVSWGKLWHTDVQTFGLFTLITSVFLAVVCAKGRNRIVILNGLILFACAAFFGLPGFILSLLLTGLMVFTDISENRFVQNLWVNLAILIAALIFSGAGVALYTAVQIKLSAYLKPAADNAGALQGPLYPGIAQSVIEAQNVPFDSLVQSVTGSPLLWWAGAVSVVLLFVLRPDSIYLLPFFALFFAAMKMGGRFSMFAGAPLGLGMGYVGYWLIGKMKLKSTAKFAHAAVGLLLAGIMLIYVLPIYKSFSVTPIMGSNHAKALIATGKQMPEDATVWTWWDWGYATLYYTGKHSFANGGHHQGTSLLPLGLAYTTSSPKQSNQLIKYSALHGNNPAAAWEAKSSLEVFEFLKTLGSKDFNFGKTPKQYIVASWDNVRLAYWILYYGSWNVVNGSGVHPQVFTVRNAFDIDNANGVIAVRNEGPVKVSAWHILNNKGMTSQAYPQSVGPVLLYNETVSQGFFVDIFSYQSMLVRLLLSDPKDKRISDYFKLVYEGFPNIRVYEVI